MKPHVPFFLDTEKSLMLGSLRWVSGNMCIHIKAKTPGATGSFCFIVISLCCYKIRIPLAIKIVKVGERQNSWLVAELKQALKIAPRAIVLADRGFWQS